MRGDWTRAAAKAALAMAGAAALAAAAVAQPVTLTTRDGNMTITGTLRGFDGEVLTVETSLGEISVPAALVTCAGEGCPDLGLAGIGVPVSGSATIGAALMPALVLGLADLLDADIKQTPARDGDGVTLEIVDVDGETLGGAIVASTDSTAGLAALIAGEAELAMASRPVTEDERRAFVATGRGDLATPANERVLALDGLSVIVAPANPVQVLSVEQIAAIFSGAVTNWREVGGPDAPIALHGRDPAAGNSEILARLALEPAGRRQAEGLTVHDRDEALADAVAADPNAIGYVGMAYVRSARAVAIRSACGVVRAPDLFAVKTEEYPLARRLYIYGGGDGASDWARDMIDFAVSARAQPLIRDIGFVDQEVEPAPAPGLGDRLLVALMDDGANFDAPRMRELAAELMDATRLSVTFRFTPDGTALDNKAQRDLPRLIDHLARPEMRGKEVLLVGFTDSAGSASANRALSLRRAEIALEALRAAAPDGALDGVTLGALGYGELAPSRCNATEHGREANRRIEVWVRDPR